MYKGRTNNKYNNKNGNYRNKTRNSEPEVKESKVEPHTAPQSKFAKPTHTTWASLKIDTPPQPTQVEVSQQRQHHKPMFSPISTSVYVPQEKKETEPKFELNQSEKFEEHPFTIIEKQVTNFPSFESTEHVNDKLYFAASSKPINTEDIITIHPTENTIIPPPSNDEYYFVPVLCWVPVKKGEDLAAKGFRLAKISE